MEIKDKKERQHKDAWLAEAIKLATPVEHDNEKFADILEKLK